MKSEIKVNLVFSDFPMSPTEFSRELGADATQSWSKGEAGVVEGVIKKNNGWELNSGIEPTKEFELHISALLEKIRFQKHSFVEMSKRYPPVLSCVVYSYDGARPYIGFSKSAIKELAELNATIDVDLYVL